MVIFSLELFWNIKKYYKYYTSALNSYEGIVNVIKNLSYNHFTTSKILEKVNFVNIYD